MATLQQRFEQSMVPLKMRNLKRMSYVDRAINLYDETDAVYTLLEELEKRKGIRWRIAVEQYDIQGRTFDEVAGMLNVSCERVRQIRLKALKELGYIGTKRGMDELVIYR